MNQFFTLHPYVFTALGVYVLSGILTGVVGLLDAPTKTSSRSYARLFRFANGFVGNFKRASSTSVESSPNWRDAIEKYIAERDHHE